MSCSNMPALGHVFWRLHPVVPSDAQLPLSASWSSSSSAFTKTSWDQHIWWREETKIFKSKQIPKWSKCKLRSMKMLRHPWHPPKLQSNLVPFWSTCPKHPNHVVTRVSLHKATKGRNSGTANILLLVGCSMTQNRDCRTLCETSTREASICSDCSRCNNQKVRVKGSKSKSTT